jgi:hypothetical protein
LKNPTDILRHIHLILNFKYHSLPSNGRSSSHSELTIVQNSPRAQDVVHNKHTALQPCAVSSTKQQKLSVYHVAQRQITFHFISTLQPDLRPCRQHNNEMNSCTHPQQEYLAQLHCCAYQHFFVLCSLQNVMLSVGTSRSHIATLKAQF